MQLIVTKEQLQVLKNYHANAIQWYSSELAKITNGEERPKRFLGKIGSIDIYINEEQ